MLPLAWNIDFFERRKSIFLLTIFFSQRRRKEKMVVFEENALDELAEKIAKKVIDKLDQEKQPYDMSFAQAQKALFHNKSRDWIKYYLIHKHPEILTINGGWITPPVKKGVRIKVIDVLAAKEWIKQNQNKIDWNAPEPITIKRRMGLAKPIKRK